MKVGFVSLGCPKNLVDTEVMMGQLVARGHALTPRPDHADVIVVNTCSFIRSAQQESVDAILEMARQKASGRAKKLIVAGCLVERFGDEIRHELPEVDALVSVNDIDRVVRILREARDGDGKSPPLALLPCHPVPTGRAAARARPGTRGRARHWPPGRPVPLTYSSLLHGTHARVRRTLARRTVTHPYSLGKVPA